MDVESLAKQLILKGMTEEQQKAVLDSIRSTMASSRELQKQRVGENARLVVEALRKIEADIRSRYDEVGNKIEERVASIKDGKDGRDGVDGRPGKDGRPGRDGATGPRGADGLPGRDGRDGVDGVSVTDARIDFDGSLIIGLSSGREINVGEVVAPDLAEKIKVITNGGGTSQSVLDTLASLQTQINNLIPSQTGNAGKFLTTNGSVLSWATVAGGLSYQGTWNASTNTPTLASGVGTNGYYYIVSTAGSTNLDGITDWQVGDWLLFNGSVWQKIDQSELVTDIESIDNSVTVTFNSSVADLSVYSSPRLIAQVRNETGSTLTKGTVVYISGAAGNKATVSKALATSDSTSAQTFGVIAADIPNNQNGNAILAGELSGLDTSAFAAGTQLYLSSTTAGGYTSTKQYAPNHLVYVGVVTRSHANQGTIEVRIQNGYEMDELHNVSAQSPSNGQVLIYNASTSLWEKNTLTDGTGISITEGAGSITITNSAPDQVVSLSAGTGISTSGTYPSFTITNSAPDQVVALTGAGTTAVTGTYPNFTITSNDQYVGTVTSVGGTGTVNGITLSGTVTSSGNLTLGGTLSGVDLTTQVTGTLPIANGGTGLTALGTGVQTALGVNTGSAGAFVVNGGALGTPSSGTVTNLTGTASININGTVGATTPNTGSFTSLTDSGNLTFTGTGNRITGDFSNATIANRVMFQTSTVNSSTSVSTIPSGTNTQSDFFAFNAADPNNASLLLMRAGTAETTIRSGITGTGTYLPMTFYTGGSERMRIDTSGNVGIGTSSAALRLDVLDSQNANTGGQVSNTNSGTSASVDFRVTNGTNYGGIRTFGASHSAAANQTWVFTAQSNPLIFATNFTERARIDSSGNVGIGTSSPQGKFNVGGGRSNFGANSEIYSIGLGYTQARVSSGQTYYIGATDSATPAIVFSNAAGTERARITDGGEVYIAGTTDQGAYNLQVNGTGVWGAGAYVNGSDARLKENVQTLTDGLSVVTQLRPVTFQYKADYSKDTAVQPGFIAQELQQAMADKDYVDGVVQAGPEYLNVAYQSLIPVLTKAIQELTAKLTAAEARIAALEKA